MKHVKRTAVYFLAVCLVAGLLPVLGWAWEPIPETYQFPPPRTYIPTFTEIFAAKARLDDPRPPLAQEKVLPPDLYEKLTYDIEEMKNLWAEVVGLKAPDLVGKIAPDIKPGKYTYQDKEKYPGLKELMWPIHYELFRPGGPPYAGAFPEIEVVDTQQYYWAPPIAQASLDNMGKTKLDDQGYPDWRTWEGGILFPRPSGKYKARQLLFNIERRYKGWELDHYIIGEGMAFNKELEMDMDSLMDVVHVRLSGRVQMPPYGFLDKRAKERGEWKQLLFGFHSPRDIAGAVNASLFYLDKNTQNQEMMYVPSLRRIRKMSATDTQDPIMGQDLIYDDREGFMQKLTPDRYPYKYEILEEREYLLPAHTDGTLYYSDEEGMPLKNVKFERRPVYVVKMTQLDPNYVYGVRISLIDKETFMYYHISNFDQKDRLYRTWDCTWGWHPKMGTFTWHGCIQPNRDCIDVHSSLAVFNEFPANWRREDLSLRSLVRKAK